VSSGAGTPTAVGDDAPRRPESFFGALFALLALMLVFGVGVAMFGLRLQNADAVELYAEVFGPDAELPMDLERAGGTAVANKQRWIRLERRADAPADPALPESVLVGRFDGPLAVARQFETRDLLSGPMLDERLRTWREEPKDDFQALLEKGLLPLGPYETDFLRLRQYLADGHFYDLVRIDLSAGEYGQILVAQWPLDSELASVAAMRPVLDQLLLPTVAEVAGQGAAESAGER
jgi:hypothetical protein